MRKHNPHKPEEYKSALMALTKDQVINLSKKIKGFLSLNTANKSKAKIVDNIMELHGTGIMPNEFFGKPLLSFGDGGHIKVPRRETLKERKDKKLDKKIDKVKKNQEKLAELRRRFTEGEDLETLQKELKKISM